MIERLFQLKVSWSTGVCPRGAQVRTRVGRVLSPLSSTRCPAGCSVFRVDRLLRHVHARKKIETRLRDIALERASTASCFGPKTLNPNAIVKEF